MSQHAQVKICLTQFLKHCLETFSFILHGVSILFSLFLFVRGSSIDFFIFFICRLDNCSFKFCFICPKFFSFCIFRLLSDYITCQSATG